MNIIQINNNNNDELEKDNINNINYNDIETITLNKIYRQSDEEFINKLLYTYETGKIDYINEKISIKDCIKNNIII